MDDFIEPPGFDLSRISARLFGYPWDDISSYEQEPIDAALQAGYTQDEIDAFQGKGGLQDRLNADLTSRVAYEPQFASGLRAPSESIPLTPMDELPSWRIGQLAGRDDTPRVDPLAEYIEPPPNPEDVDDHARQTYANALLRGQVTSPRDFAERYAGAVLGADPMADQGSLTRSASVIGASLPSDQDFTDQAIAISQNAGIELTPEGVRTVKERLVDHWADTGDSLFETIRQASIDDEFKDSLTAPPPEQPNWLDQFGTGFLNVAGGMRQLIANSLPDSFKQTIDEANKTLADAGFPMTPFERVGIQNWDAIERGRLAMMAEEGNDNSWWQWGGEVAATLPMFTTLGLSGGWALVAAGATGAAAAAAFTPSTAEDYWSSKAVEMGTAAVGGAALGGALYGVGKAVAAMSPQAAGLLRNVISRMEEPKVKVLDPGAEIPVIEQPASEALRLPQPAERVPVPEPVEGAAPEPVGPPKFVETATPAEKMQALASDVLDGKADTLERMRLQNEGFTQDEFGPNFFSRLAADQDAPTKALAEGMDGAHAIGGYLLDLGRNLLHDESGALTLFRTPAQKVDLAAGREARDYVQELLIRGMGATARGLEEYGAKFDYYRNAAGKTENLQKLVNAHMPEWRGEIEKGPMGNPMGTVIGEMVQYIEGRSAGVTLRADHPLAPVADTIRAVNQSLRQRMEDAQAAGLHNMTSYYDDYFRHIWKDLNAADRAFGVARQGSGASFRERSLPTVSDGLARGLEPKYQNPIELTMFDAAEKMRYLNTLDMLDQARNTTLPLSGQRAVQYAHSAPVPGWVRLNGVGTEKQVPALGKNGMPIPPMYAYANPMFAKNWNDNIATGFFARDFTGKVFEHVNYLKNLQTQGQLIGPFFHARTIGTETIAGGFANVASELISAGTHAVQGRFGAMLQEIGRAGADFGKTAVFPLKLTEQLMRGSKGLAIYQGRASDPALDPVVSLLTEANARFGKRQEIYRFSRAPTLMESWKRGSFREEYHEQMVKLRGDPSQPIAALPLLGRLGLFAGHEVGRFLNTTTAPLFDFAIPRLKIGVNIERMQTYLRRNPTATAEQKLAQARQIVNNTDDRMGEMNMDNIFWPKMVKQAAQLSMISPGWVYGSARFFTNAVGMNMERGKFIPFTQWNEAATTSLVGFTMAIGLVNSITQYLYTGELPKDWKDVALGPLTGAVINGVRERVMAPSQQKEIFDYGKIIATGIFDPMKVPHEVIQYVLGKMPGLWQMARGLMTGEDAIGHKIGATAGGWPAFFLKNLTPIMATAGEQRKQGTGINWWDSMFGARQVPRFAMDPEGFYSALQKAHDREQRDEHYRAIAENRIYEQQREVPDLPASMHRGSRGGGAGAVDPDELAARKITRQRHYRSDDYNLPPVFDQYNGYRARPRSLGRSTRVDVPTGDGDTTSILGGSSRRTYRRGRRR